MKPVYLVTRWSEASAKIFSSSVMLQVTYASVCSKSHVFLVPKTYNFMLHFFRFSSSSRFFLRPFPVSL